MTLRASQKQRSKNKMLDDAGRHLRSEGLGGAAMAAVKLASQED